MKQDDRAETSGKENRDQGGALRRLRPKGQEGPEQGLPERGHYRCCKFWRRESLDEAVNGPPAGAGTYHSMMVSCCYRVVSPALSDYFGD